MQSKIDARSPDGSCQNNAAAGPFRPAAIAQSCGREISQLTHIELRDWITLRMIQSHAQLDLEFKIDAGPEIATDDIICAGIRSQWYRAKPVINARRGLVQNVRT